MVTCATCAATSRSSSRVPRPPSKPSRADSSSVRRRSRNRAIRDIAACDAPARRGFEIAPSRAADAPQVSVPPDFFACDDCVAELADPADRRHGYPFINCTQCGPRYTLIEALPYDRPNTSMAGFPLCAACRREYQDPLDRRFHAEPVACPVCGPHLAFVEPGRAPVTGDAAAVAAAVEILRTGRVLAVRGIGGYHLLCDACDEVAVRRLRERKRRPDKPLAVMFPQRGTDGLDAARCELEIGAVEQAALADPARPIVLVRQRAGGRLAPSVAPGLTEIGSLPALQPVAPPVALCVRRAGDRDVGQRQRRTGADRPGRGRDAPRAGRRRVPAPRSADRASGGRLGRADCSRTAATDPAGTRRRAARTRVAVRPAGTGARRGRAPEAHRRAGLGPSHRRVAAHRRHGHVAQRAGLRAGRSATCSGSTTSRHGTGSAMRTRATRPRAGCRPTGGRTRPCCITTHTLRPS